jgi:glycosyltransferase involved in cell wall biosynthesis
MLTNKNRDLRVFWLLPITWFYWQPMLSEFTKIFPKTKIFTGRFPGFTPGLEQAIAVETIGKFQLVGKKNNAQGYSSRFTSLSPKIIFPLLRAKPELIFTSSFGIWTILALLLKPLGRWRVVIAYEGSSPSVDFTNSSFRLGLRRLMVKAADAYITNSQAGKNYLTKVLHAKPESVFAHPYEVPAAEAWLKDSTENAIALKLKRPIFLFVGRVIRRKGLHLLLEACNLLKQQGYNNYSVLVVGDGEQRAELEAFCQDNELTDWVEWKGWVEYAQLNSYFRSADIFVLPTLEDTWGVVTLEVMLFGKPVLCSKGAGSAEMIIDGENGYVFDCDRPERLAELMGKFITQPELIASMGQKSQQLIAKYTPQAAAESLAKVVEFMSNH